MMVSQGDHMRHLVIVVGAGPAALYATGKIAAKGHTVVILNRDIKPGGLAEYGIYLSKHKMKEGLRKQFRQILADPRIIYFGGVTVGDAGAIRLSELQDLKPNAIVVGAGAQGTKPVRRGGGLWSGNTMTARCDPSRGISTKRRSSKSSSGFGPGWGRSARTWTSSSRS